MNDKIILPIHHIYAELIFSGQKTLEIRKTAPRGKGKYIIYMYETKRDGGAGAVVGFFICKAQEATNCFADWNCPQREQIRKSFIERSCLTAEQLEKYANGDCIYGWRTNTPIRFPRPRPLSDFGLARAPQSWQYLK